MTELKRCVRIIDGVVTLSSLSHSESKVEVNKRAIFGPLVLFAAVLPEYGTSIMFGSGH
jgi:hypothetical protein